MRLLTVSFGAVHPANITAVKQLTWEKFAGWLTAEPPEATDKAERGWYIPATFDKTPCGGSATVPCPLTTGALGHRDSDHFVSRDAITLDFDHVSLDTFGLAMSTWQDIAFAIYTTYSHTHETPRFRVVIPLSRPASYDEFQAVARMVASDIGIELVARESLVPSQMMFSPTKKSTASFESYVGLSRDFLDVDAVLAEYEDWTDVKQWPRRVDGDGVHSSVSGQTPPDEKPGIVGAFCRAFRVSAAIAAFNLPYTPTSTEGRWTYTNGSRPEGAIEYDDGLKFHSHHDTDPARGQCNAFDLVRLHRFGALDGAGSEGIAVTNRPSYRAMADMVSGLPEVAGTPAADQYPDLGPAPTVTEEILLDEAGNTVERFLVRSADEFSSGAPVDWIVRGVFPRAELAVIYGESGSGKSFLALDLCAAVTRGIDWRNKRTAKGRVVYVCAEGAGGFKARLRAYARGHSIELRELPAVIADAPNMLEPKDAALVTRSIVNWGKVDVVVIDTLSATTPGGNENSGEDMGRVLSHCKLLHRQTGALVVLIHHSGKDATKGARGWSGLRAAADAEIEVTRNGDFRAATVTKMKDGSDGEQWPFRLKTLVLGLDHYGEEESSCIVEHTEDMAPNAVTKERPTGARQIIVFGLIKTLAPSGTMNIDDLLEAYLVKTPKGDGKDNRRRDAKSALEGLIAKKLAFMHENERVSLTTNIQLDEGDWLA